MSCHSRASSAERPATSAVGLTAATGSGDPMVGRAVGSPEQPASRAGARRLRARHQALPARLSIPHGTTLPADVSPVRRGAQARDPGLQARRRAALAAPARSAHRLGRGRMSLVPAQPEGETPPPDGALPPASVVGWGRRPFSRLRPRAVLHDTLRLLRLQHLHRTGAGRSGGVDRDHLRRAPHRGAVAGPADPGARRRARRHGVRRRRDADAVDAGGAGLGAASHRRRVRPRPRGRDHHRGQPRLRGRGRACRAAARRASPGSASGCRARCRTCSPFWTARTRPGGALAAVEQARRSRLRAREPRPHLRHARGVTGRLGALGRGGAGCRGRPHLGLRAHRRARHAAGGRGAPRGRSPPPTTT